MKSVILLLLFFISLPAHSKIRAALYIEDFLCLKKGCAENAPGNEFSKVLAALKRHSVPEVIGFVNGSHVIFDEKVAFPLGYSDAVKNWVKSGYIVANGAFSKASPMFDSAAEVKKSVLGNEAYVKKFAASGQDWKIFRFPSLFESKEPEKMAQVFSDLKNNGYRLLRPTLLLDFNMLDLQYKKCLETNEAKAKMTAYIVSKTVQSLLDTDKLARALFNRSVDHIIGLDLQTFDISIIEELLTALEKAGVEFIPISTALKDDVYKEVVKPSEGGEWIYQIALSRGFKDVRQSYLRDWRYSKKEMREGCPGY